MKFKAFISLLCLICFITILGCSGGSNDDDESGTTITTSMAGKAQKGPFLNGQEVNIFEKNDNLNDTGLRFTPFTNHSGSFETTGISTSFASVHIDGFYYNEIDNTTNSKLALKALTEITENSTVNVNLLTSIACDRIRELYLTDNLKFSEAKQQAKEEILENIFHIPSDIIDTVTSFEKMDISKDGQSNAILLAASVILQGDNSAANLSSLVTNIMNDIKLDGELNNQGLIDELKENAMNLDQDQIRENLEYRYNYLNNVYNAGIEFTIPPFEEYIDLFE